MFESCREGHFVSVYRMKTSMFRRTDLNKINGLQRISARAELELGPKVWYTVHIFHKTHAVGYHV